MINLIFGSVLLILVGAVVLLFAMFGEVVARLPELHLRDGDASVRPLPEARLGEQPIGWPDRLADVVNTVDPALLLVLSTACASCEAVGDQLSNELDKERPGDTAVVVSCGDARSGEDFVVRHGLQRLPFFVDEGGRWVAGAFGVQTSPTALVIRDGRLDSALLFSQVAALRAAVPNGGAAVPAREEVAA
jgi:hypothetical protein